MSDTYRLAGIEDAEEVLAVIRGAYESIRELGVQFTAVNADLGMITDNIANHSCQIAVLGRITLTNQPSSIPF